MANLVYLTLNGQIQGLISAGCSSQTSIGNKAQIAHLDQIIVLGLSHGLSRAQNVNHLALTIQKPVDKSTPLLSSAACIQHNYLQKYKKLRIFWRKINY